MEGQHSNQREEEQLYLRQREQRLDQQKIIELIKEGMKTQTLSKDGDVILLAGSTGSGKSTTANYLLGNEMFVTKIETQKTLKGHEGKVKYLKQVIDSKGQFRIGHSKESQTSNLQIAQVKERIFICDSPGFFDNRGAEMEIANATILENFLKNCNSVRLVVLISYPELTAQRGALFKETYKLIKRILKSPEKKSFEQILLLFSNVPKNENNESIQQEVIDAYEVIENDEELDSLIMMNFLSVILDQLKENNIIITPTDGNHQILLERILRQTPFEKPSEEFCFSISESSYQKIELYVEETTTYISRLQEKGQFLEIMQTLFDFKQLGDYTGNIFLRECYQIQLSSISEEVKKKQEKVIDAFSEASIKSNIFSSQNIDDIKQLQSCLKIIDGYKNQFQESFDFSEELFTKQIEQICLNVCKQISEDFPVNIVNVKINLLKLKDFSESTGLGVQRYQDILEQLSQTYSKEVREFKEISGAIYLRDGLLDEKELKNKINYFVNKLELIKQTDQLLSQFIVNEEQDNFYNSITKFFSSKNVEFLDRIVTTIEQIKKNIISTCIKDCSNIIEALPLPAFEFLLLRLQSENRRYAEYISDSEENYNQALRQLKELNTIILNFVKCNFEEEIHFQLEQGLKQLDEIRRLDDSIQNQTAEEYRQFKDSIRQKIKNKINEGEKLLSYYQEEIEYFEEMKEEVEEKSFFISFKQQQKNNIKKLNNIYQFLMTNKWTDSYFNTNITKSLIDKLTENMDDFFEMCCTKIQQFANIERFDSIQFFITLLINLKIVKKIITDFDNKYQQSIDVVKSKAIDKINSINQLVNELSTETNNITHNRWKTLNDGIITVQQIQALQVLEEKINVKSDSIDKITNFMEIYYDDNFQKIKNIRVMCHGNKSYEIKSLSQKQSNFIKHAQLISANFEELKKIVGEEYSFEKLRTIINKTYDSLEQDYDSKKQENGDLQEIQSSYMILSDFVRSIDIDFLNEKFKTLNTPKQAISEAFKKFQSSIKSGDFQNLSEYLGQLKNLSSEKEKQQLNNEFENLNQKCKEEIESISDRIKSIFNNCIDRDSQNDFKSNLSNIAEIRKTLLYYRSDLFQKICEVKLNKLLSEINEQFLMKQKQQLIFLIQKFHFKQMEQSYKQLQIFTKNLERFNEIFHQDDWNVHIQTVESINIDINNTILSLHSKQDRSLNSLPQLVSALSDAENSHSSFYQQYETEKKSAKEEMNRMSKSQKEIILQKIKSQDIAGLNSARKIFQSFTNIIMENTDFEELQSDLEQYNNEIEDTLEQNINWKYCEIGKLLEKEQFDEAAKILKSIKQVDSTSYNQIIKKIKDTINTSFSQIQEGYLSIQPLQFQNILKRALNNLKMNSQFDENEDMSVGISNLFTNSLFIKSEKLFDEGENILSSSQLLFTKDYILQLFRSSQYFKIITNEFKEIQGLNELKLKLNEIKLKLNDLLIKINYKLKHLLELQQQLLSQQIKVPNLKTLCRKFEALLQIVKSDANLFTESQVLTEMKQIADKLQGEEVLVENVKKIYSTQEKQLIAALNNYDLQRVIQNIKDLKKSISVSQEFQHEFVDLNSLCKLIEKKVNAKTQEAITIIQKNINYDNKLRDLVDEIFKTDEQLKNLEEIQIPPQICLIYQELNIKLNEEQQNVIDICKHNQEDLKTIAIRIINIQKISEAVYKFTPQVEKKLLEVVEEVKKIIGEDVIFALGNILKEDASGALVVDKISSFSSYNTEKFNLLVGKHDINYIFNKLQISESGKEKQLISAELKAKLTSFYKDYSSKYKSILEKYKFQRDKWNEIIDEVQSYSKQISLPNSTWDGNSKKNVIIMIALICAYWTLSQSGEQKKGNKNVFKMPNHTQILSVILLLGIHEDDGFILQLKKKIISTEKTKFQNKLIEILTGEGKSLTLGFSALTLALLGCDVDVVCYSNYLSQRDDKDFRSLFNIFGVSQKIRYGTFNEQAERYLTDTYHDVRTAAQNVIYGNNQCLSNQNFKSQNQKILLIDEVDIFFNKGYYGQTFNPGSQFQTTEVSQIIKTIWKIRSQNSQNIKQCILNSNDYRILINKYSRFRDYINRQINQLCEDVQQIENHYQTHKYVVKNNQIGYKQDDSSISTTTSYSYHTLFAYFQQNSMGNIDDRSLESVISFTLNCGHISYALLPETYSAILGVTGTLDLLNTSIKAALKKYNIDSEIFTPSMFGTSKLDFKEVDMTSVETDQENQFLKIQEISASAVENKQAVVIFFKDKYSLDTYHQSNYTVLQKEKYIRVTDHCKPSDVDFEVQRTTRSGSIGLFVREYGRGTDFVCHDPIVQAAGGIIVIQTFFSVSKTEEIQIKGRTARQGQPGKYYLILNEKDIASDLNLTSKYIQQCKNYQHQNSLYRTLSLHRDKMENETFTNIENEINSAKNMHIKSLQFYNNIRINNINEAIMYINEFS